MLNNIKKQSGFTIVELLIVIVVIAILAAISIVAYNGIQNRGKASSAQSLASQVAKKAEAWNTIQSSYATFEQFYTNSLTPTGTGTSAVAGGATGPSEAKLDAPSKIQPGAASNESAVRYEPCGSSPFTGARISWAAGGQTGVINTGTGC
ncbi:MAG TPA: prepilin-type N-terminal cleavage/methylation domain-containing protein [Candidatus Saccharimonadales bacterium]